MGPAIGRFLKAVSTLAKNGDITIDEVYKFAKQEFGEVSDLLKVQINKIFKQSDAPSIKKPEKPKGEVVPLKPKETPDQASGIMATEEATTPLMQNLEKGVETLKAMKKPGMDLSVGLTRTAVRKILDREGIQIPDKVDPIDFFTQKYGADILMDVKNVAEEMIELEQMGKATKSIDKILEQEGMFNLPKRKNPPQGYTDEEMADIKKEIEQEDILLGFDPKDRKPNSEGGINRTNFNIGSLPKAIQALVKGINKKFGKGTMKTADEIDQPEKTTQQLISEFEERNKPDVITMESREILDVPEVPKGFTTNKEKLLEQFPEIDEDFAEQMMQMDKDLLGRTIMMLKDRRKDPEAYDRLLAEYGDTLEFQSKFDEIVRRKNNAKGGLNYLMGM